MRTTILDHDPFIVISILNLKREKTKYKSINEENLSDQSFDQPNININPLMNKYQY